MFMIQGITEGYCSYNHCCGNLKTHRAYYCQKHDGGGIASETPEAAAMQYGVP
jgi:hypothetical protein